MEVPSKLQKVDRGAKRGCFQLAEEVRRENYYTGNARKPTGGSKCSAAVGENEFNFSSRSTNLEHEYYSPTFLPPMHNANGPELHALPITGNSENQIVRVPDKIDATVFPFDNRYKDTDLQSTRIVDRNKDRKGKQVSSSLYDRLCEKNMRSEVQSADRDRKCPSSPSQKPLDNSKSGRIDATEFPFDNRDKDANLQSTRIVDRKKDRNKIDATKFPFDNQYKDTDLQSTRIVDRNKGRKGKQVSTSLYDRVCEKNMRSEVQSVGHDRKCTSSPSQKPLDNSKSGGI